MQDGTLKTAKELSFYVDGKPKRYAEGVEKMTDDT